jgi:hypothetical protein
MLTAVSVTLWLHSIPRAKLQQKLISDLQKAMTNANSELNSLEVINEPEYWNDNTMGTVYYTMARLNFQAGICNFILEMLVSKKLISIESTVDYSRRLTILESATINVQSKLKAYVIERVKIEAAYAVKKVKSEGEISPPPTKVIPASGTRKAIVFK